MKTINFAPNLIPLILQEKKWKTYRFDAKYASVKINDILDIVNAGTGDVVGKIQIKSKYWTTFGDLPHKSIGHEDYGSKDEMIEVFKSYYHRKLSQKDKMLVLYFKLL